MSEECCNNDCGCAQAESNGKPQVPFVRKPWRALKPDAQAFDEIRIITVPRYKESYLSGSEWRISAQMQFYRKGKLIFVDECSDVKHACYLVGARHMEASDRGEGHFGGERDVCDQEGCCEKATVAYRLKKEFSRDNPHEWNKPYDHVTYRLFCDRHKTRGDQGGDDTDDNYEQIEIPTT